ncbi:lysis protein [Pseudomonas aeruginosa]|nr:lysis protein [Pseudomonas aeruginosa]
MGIPSLLRSNWFWIALIAVLYSAAVVIHGSASYDRGYATGRAEGDAALLNLQLQHTNERAQSLQDSLVQYKQQVARAAQAEEQLLQVQQQLTDTRHQLQERIAHVSTAYRAAPGAAPTAIPRCVFTRGWVRDFNTALGAGLPAAERAPLPPALKQRPGPPPVLTPSYWKSGVTPADILAFAQDYGAWSLRNLAQLNALLEQGE